MSIADPPDFSEPITRSTLILYLAMSHIAQAESLIGYLERPNLTLVTREILYAMRFSHQEAASRLLSDHERLQP